VADAVQESADRAYAWGLLSALGLAIAAVTGVVDQAVKLWLVNVFELGGRDQVALVPWVDLVLTWNTGISYGLFPQEGAFGQWALLAFKAVSRPQALASAGTCSTSPMSRLLRVSWACCTIRARPGAPQKRRDRAENN
jgi:hypothetical protein